jgi:hypothetical protein
LELAQYISFDSILNSEISNFQISDNRDDIGYIPGAIGLSLLFPEGTSRRFLPKALRELEESDRHQWWQNSNPHDLLSYYNSHVSSMTSSLSALERSVVFPGHQFLLRNGEILQSGLS